MNRALVLGVLIVLLASLFTFAGGARVASAATPNVVTAPVAGNVHGPTVVSTDTNATFFINGSGGPAYLDTTLVGNLSYTASVTGTNISGVALIPSTGPLRNGTPAVTTLQVGPLVQTLTLQIEIISTNATLNETTNLTYVVNAAQPYTLTLHLEAGSSAGVAAFNLTIFLDGSPVGSAHVGALNPGENYTAVFLYPTLGLSSGEHTFTASLAQEHGLVTFAGGATSISVSFYVQSSPPSYTYWYVAGIAAFLGALFIFATRVAARRRPPAKK